MMQMMWNGTKSNHFSRTMVIASCYITLDLVILMKMSKNGLAKLMPMLQRLPKDLYCVIQDILAFI